MGVEQKMSGRERAKKKKRKKKHKEQGGVGATRLWYLSNKRHLMKDRKLSPRATYSHQPLKKQNSWSRDHKTREEGFWGMKLGS